MINNDTIPNAGRAYDLAAYLNDAKERHRYQVALRRLCMRPISLSKLVQRARLAHRVCDVRRALRDDPRFERVHGRARERYALRAPYRYAARLQGATP